MAEVKNLAGEHYLEVMSFDRMLELFPHYDIVYTTVTENCKVIGVKVLGVSEPGGLEYLCSAIDALNITDNTLCCIDCENRIFPSDLETL